MNAHRTSYLKTALASLAASVVLFVLAGYEIAVGSILAPFTGAAFLTSSFLRWASVVGFVALGVLGLLVAMGGFFALHEDANEGRAAAAQGFPEPQ